MHRTFLKSIPPTKFQIELDMSVAGHKLGNASNLFYAPKVVSFDSKKSSIDFERIEGATDLRVEFIRLLRKPQRSNSFIELKSMMTDAAKIIASIHEDTKIFSHIEKREGSYENMFTDNEVYLHGDFTLRNLLLDTSSKSYYLVDWSSSALLTKPINYGPLYWDLTFFISEIFFYSYSTFFSYAKRSSLAIVFIDQYALEVGQDKFLFRKKVSEFVTKYNTYNLIPAYNVSWINKVIRHISYRQLIKFTRHINGLEMSSQ